MDLPKAINPCPIIESIFEMRFNSSLPEDAVFGILYEAFKKDFQNYEPLPILQLPQAIRIQDPNLQFSPYYKLSNAEFIMQLGPKVFSLGCIGDYMGWEKFSSRINEAYLTLNSLQIITKILRFGLRYINFFEDIDLLSKTNLQMKLGNETLFKNRMNLSVEFIHNNASSILKIINSAEVTIKEKNLKGCILDIDTSMEKIGEKEDFLSTINYMHDNEKKVFFDALGSDVINSFKPKY